MEGDRVLFVPARTKDVEHLVAAAAAVVERDAKRDELGLEPPAPPPTVRRPPANWSSEASSFARCTGWRMGRTITLVPKPTVLVAAAAQVSVITGS